jgi:hypothetical protein
MADVEQGWRFEGAPVRERLRRHARLLLVASLLVGALQSTPVMYWGWVVGRITYDDRVPFRFQGHRFDFLIVVDMAWLETPQGLRESVRGLRVVERTDRYAVFDLRGRDAGTN